MRLDFYREISLKLQQAHLEQKALKEISREDIRTRAGGSLPTGSMKNALTIDVEDYFHATAFEKSISVEDWERQPLRVVENTLGILDILDEFSARGTFFVLGWVAERRPGLVKEIHRRGHEIACHGYGHQLIYRNDPEDFRKDLRRARMVLEDICGEKIKGFRAPSFSITRKSLWALDVIIEEGFAYDSSIFPVVHDIYGIKDSNGFPHEIKRPGGSIKEFPLSTLSMNFLCKKIKLPISGGGYLRFFPLWLIKGAMRLVNERHGQPVVLYFHPWEIDPEQPRIKAGLKSRLRHYHNLEKTEEKIRKVLSSFHFFPMKEILKV